MKGTTMERGFYKYKNGGQTLIFLLTYTEQWYAINDSGEMYPCNWGYIEQAVEALGGLERIS